MKHNTRKTLSDNLKILMKRPGMDSQMKVSKRAGIGQTTLGMLLKPDHPVSPKLDTVAAVAEAFGLQTWQLLHPALGNAGKGQDVMARLTQISPKERMVVYKLLEMEPVSDVKVSEHLHPPRNKAKLR